VSDRYPIYAVRTLVCALLWQGFRWLLLGSSMGQPEAPKPRLASGFSSLTPCGPARRIP